MTATVVRYVRVSTDDKGQNPERQVELLDAWGAQHDVHAVGTVIDEGTSASKTNPFERPAFMVALQRAKDAGADLLVVNLSRFTRQGAEEDAWAKVELRRTHGVRLFVADYGGPDEQDGHGFQVMRAAMDSEGNHLWAVGHGAAVSSGMATASKAGVHVGRPRKTFSHHEDALMREMYENGSGYRTIAHRVSTDRGAYRVADRKAQRRLAVSYMSVARRLSDLGVPARD